MTDRSSRRLIAFGVLVVAVFAVGALGVWSPDTPWVGTTDGSEAAGGTPTAPPAWTVESANRSRCGDRCFAVTVQLTNTGATATNVTLGVTLRPEGTPTPVWSETVGVGPVAADAVVGRRATIGIGPLALPRLQDGNCRLVADVIVRWDGPESPHRTTATIDNVCQTLFVR